MHRSLLRSAFGVAVLIASLLVVTAVPASAATPSAANGNAGGSAGQMTQQEWATLKADLNSSSLGHTVTVNGGTRTFTYTLPTGSTLVLSEPVGPQSGVTPELGLGGCGWFQLCVYLNRADQSALIQGGLAALAAVICIIGSPAACVVAAFALGAALSYIGSNGFCSNQLQVELLPFPGTNVRCV